MKTWRSARAPALALTVLAAATLGGEAQASTFAFTFTGPGVSGSLALTYGPTTDSKVTSGFEITGISGTFSDSNNGLNIVNLPVGALVTVSHDAPEGTNLLAPHDFSRFAVVGSAEGGLTFDNLYYPGGSPQTATSYPVFGGFLDIYGILFNIGGGRVVDVWSNGAGTNGLIDYGVGVATAGAQLDYVSGGVTAVPAVPEPASFWMLGGGLAATLAFVRRRGRESAA